MEGQPPASAMPSPAGASKPAAAATAPGAKPASPRRNNLRHIIVVALLGVLALGVSGAIIYFTLHVTGVIENITQNSSTESTSDEDADYAEYYSLVSRVNALRDDPSTEDEALEADLKDYAGRMINEKGKDSQEAYDAIMLLMSYYDIMGLYDNAKEYLEERISVSDDDQKVNSYIAELYRLASGHGDSETAEYYLNQINDETDPQIKSAKLQAVAYQMLIDILSKDNYSDEDGEANVEHDHSDCETDIQKLREFAEEAERIYSTADTAYLLATVETYTGNEEKATEYMNLASERDPNKYPLPQEGSNSDGQ